MSEGPSEPSDTEMVPLTSPAVPLLLPPDDSWWNAFADGYGSGFETGLTEGWQRGRREAWDRAWSMTVQLMDARDDGPWLPWVPADQLPIESLPLPARPRTHISDRRPATAAQLLAEARWSWARVERRIRQVSA